MLESHKLEMVKCRQRQMGILRRGLREAAQILSEMTDNISDESDELVLDMSELEETILSSHIIEVTDEMIVEVTPPPKVYSVIDELEKFMGGVQTYRSLH